MQGVTSSPREGRLLQGGAVEPRWKRREALGTLRASAFQLEARTLESQDPSLAKFKGLREGPCALSPAEGEGVEKSPGDRMGRCNPGPGRPQRDAALYSKAGNDAETSYLYFKILVLSDE